MKAEVKMKTVEKNTLIEQEQRPLGKNVEQAEAERRHALYTSDGKARLEREPFFEGSAISKRTVLMHRGEG